MVKCNLSRMMGEKRLNISDVVRLTGIPRSSVTNLYKDDAVRIELETIDKLCDLFECEVGDLLERQTDD